MDDRPAPPPLAAGLLAALAGVGLALQLAVHSRGQPMPVLG